MYIMWLIVPLIIGVGIGALVLWLRSQDIKVAWYEWLIGAIGLLLVLWALPNYFGSQAEAQPTAANMFLLFFGLPGVVLLVVSLLLPWRRQSAAG